MTNETIGLADEFILNPDLGDLDIQDAINHRLERLETLAYWSTSEDYSMVNVKHVQGIGNLVQQITMELKVLFDRYGEVTTFKDKAA